jgi:hypothetical protein
VSEQGCGSYWRQVSPHPHPHPHHLTRSHPPPRVTQLVPPTPTRRGWFGLGGSKEDKEASSPKSPDSGGSVGFTAADLSQLADVFSMDADVGKASDDPLALLYIFKVEMQKAALQLVQASDGLAIVDGCMTDLHGSAHLFPTTKDVRLSLGSYYIDVPEGRLLASSPGSHEALTASVVLNPHQRPNTQVRHTRA